MVSWFATISIALTASAFAQTNTEALVSHAEFSTDDFCRYPYEAICPRVDWIKERAQQKTADTLLLEALKAEKLTVYANLEAVKSTLRAAIEASIDARDRKSMLERVEAIRIMSIRDIVLLRSKQDDDSKRIVVAYDRICGIDGASDNGFMVPYKGRDRLIICPGKLLSLTGTKKENFYGALWIIAHEVGHAIDHARYPALYESFLKCIGDEHGHELEYADICPDDSAPWLGSDKAVRHARELTADHWSIKAVANYLRSHDLPRNESLTLLRHSMGTACSSIDGGSHASGRFRIETMLRRDPEISELMGCTAQVEHDARRGCTLSGSTATPLY